MSLHTLLLGSAQLLATLICLAAVAYLALALWCVLRFRTDRPAAGDPAACPGLTVFKPLCGAEPELADGLRSFCRQDYPGPLQIVFGVRSPSDPAIAVVRQLQGEFPDRRLDLVVDATVHGPNLKVSNLVNMERAALHPIWVVSDSDVQVAPDCLRQAVGYLADEDVGAVTCLFRGRPRRDGNWVSQLGSLFIDAWFLPAAIVDATLFGQSVCYGPVTAIRREILAARGGFAQLARVLADDTELGHVTTREGRRVVLAPMAADTLVAETSLPDLLRHELRWARTTRALRPMSYLASLVTHALPVALALFLLRPTPLNGLLAGLIAALRIGVLAAVDGKLGRADTARLPSPPFLILREILYVGVWATAFAGRRITWRGRDLTVVDGANIAEGRPGGQPS